MTAFKRIARGLDVQPALEEIALNPIPTGNTQLEGYGFRIIKTPFIGRPQLTSLALQAERLIPGRVIGGVLNVTPSGGVLAPHRDLLPDKIQRYHVVLQSGPMAAMIIGRERKKQKPGEVWALNLRHRLHEVRNHDELDRIILILDAWSDERPFW